MREKIDTLRVRALSNPILVILFVAPFLKPVGVVSISHALNWGIAIWKMAVALLVAVFFLSRPKVSAATAVLGVFYALTVLSTRINSDDSLYPLLNDIVSIGVLCVMMDEAVDTDPKALVRGLTYCLGALCIINSLSIVLTRCGIGIYVGREDFYFLGLDNSHGFYIIPLLPILLLYAWNARWPLAVQIALLVFFTASIYVTWSVSGVVAASAFLLLFVLWRARRIRKVCNIGVYYAVIAAVFLLLVVLQVTEMFSFVIEGVLHKSLTLSGRTPLWRAHFPYVLAKPWLGYGMYFSCPSYPLLGQCHNIFLQNVFNTGIVGSVVYLAALGLLVRPLLRTRKSFGGYILAAGMFAFLLILEVESLVWPIPFYILFMLCWNAEKVIPALDPGPETI